MVTLRRALLLLLLAATSLVQAQLYPPAHSQARGGGTMQGCDTSLHVGFTSEIVSAYTHVFTPVVSAGATAITSSNWNYYTTDWFDLLGEVNLQVAFPGMGDYPVCLTVNAIDADGQQPCSTTVCDLFQPLADSSCASLVADFTIASVDGQTVTFADLSSFATDITQHYWSFGDGASTVQGVAEHSFDGPGPFEVCLTVVGPAPIFCSATTCKWLYLGPSGVECGTVLQQGFLFLQQENLVGVLDTSSTFGMNNAITWDFGDGTVAEGNVAVHAYPQGSFQLCSTVRVWGPLTADTCTSTLCRTVEAIAMVGVAESLGVESLRAWPNPFFDKLTLTGLAPSTADLRIHDACGRVVYQALIPGGSHSLSLNLEALAPGTYILQCSQEGRAYYARAMKQ